MAFEIQDLMVDVLPRSTGRAAAVWAACEPTTDVTDSECPEPSCAPNCQPRSHCGPVTKPGPPPPRPEPDGRSAGPTGLLLLRRQLHETLNRQL